MPGLYTHTPRPTGTTITQTIYDGDHQNHIDNLEPPKIDDYSGSAAQMRSTADPGESGSESLATTLAGELERLRFVLAEMKGTTYWYQSTTTKRQMFEFERSTITDPTATVWPNATSNWISLRTYIPPDYAGGDITVKLWRSFVGATTGNAVMSRNAGRSRASFATVTLDTATAMVFSAGDNNPVQETWSYAAANFAVGDVLSLDILRTGDDVNDTATGAVAYGGAWIEYTGYAGRL